MITEQEILESLKILIKKSSEFSNVLLGSGDDAAIIKTKEELVHSIDISVEGIHFLEELIPAEYIAYRSIAIALSCLLYTSPSPRDKRQSRMPSSA